MPELGCLHRALVQHVLAGSPLRHHGDRQVRDALYTLAETFTDGASSHELYVYADTYDMYTNFAPKLDGRYLSSNVNITVADPKAKPSENKTISVPVGNRFTKFTTTLGRKVTSLGVLYDFTDNDKNTTVQKVEDMVKEQWVSQHDGIPRYGFS